MKDMDREFDKAILKRLREGDESALKSLFDRYYMPLCIYSVQYTDFLQVSEDLVQEVFISFWERKAYRNVDFSIYHYLFGAVRNASLNYLRNERPYALHELEESVLQESDWFEIDEDEEDDAKALCRERLNRALKQLSPQEYKVFCAVVFEDKKYKEVAEDLNLSINSVKTYLARALKFLRSQSLLLDLFYICF